MSSSCFPRGYFPGIGNGLVAPPDRVWRLLPIAMIDLETTCLRGPDRRIWEIGVCRAVNGEITGTSSWLVNPKRKLHNSDAYTHKVLDSELEMAPTLPKVWGEVREFIRGHIPAAHNVAFDRTVLTDEVGHQEETGRLHWICTLLWSRELFPRSKHHLGELCKRLGVKLGEAHRAASDAEAAMKCLLIMAEHPGMPKLYSSMLHSQSELERRLQPRRSYRTAI